MVADRDSLIFSSFTLYDVCDYFSRGEGRVLYYFSSKPNDVGYLDGCFLREDTNFYYFVYKLYD